LTPSGVYYSLPLGLAPGRAGRFTGAYSVSASMIWQMPANMMAGKYQSRMGIKPSISLRAFADIGRDAVFFSAHSPTFVGLP
jgi:hypothetical protein